MALGPNEAASQVTLHPHGELTTYFGRTRGGVVVGIRPGLTIRGLLLQLGVPPNEVWVSARNGSLAEPDDELMAGDVLEIFSPVAGGRPESQVVDSITTVSLPCATTEIASGDREPQSAKT